MEPVEAISAPNLSEDQKLGFQASLSQNLDRDPVRYDHPDHTADGDMIHVGLQKLELQEKEDEAEKGCSEGEQENGNGKSYESDGDLGPKNSNENENEKEGWVANENDGWGTNENEGWGTNGNEGGGTSGNEGWGRNENEGWGGNENEGWGGNENEGLGGNGNEGWDANGKVEKKDEKSLKSFQYPVRPEAEDCVYYLKTGTCKFGLNCKFNHPLRKKIQAVREKIQDKEDSEAQASKAECKYYSRTGGCKFGKDCRFNHPREKASIVAILELNFLGLPIRPGEKECPYYMRNGSCKFGANCRFNHPDPTAAGVADPTPGYGNGGSLSLQGVPQPAITSWSSPRTVIENASYAPVRISPSQVVPSQNPEWNGYQAPTYPERSGMLPVSAYAINSPAVENNPYTHQQPQMQVEEFPERPGQPECNFFLKTGDCKFKSNCKYHHPKNRIARSNPCTLSDKGLPLRPDQNICSHYSRYGICKFGPACKFDHPIQPPYGRSVDIEGAGISDVGRRNNGAIQ